MKNVKRILSLVLAGVMMLTVLAGCSMPKLVLGGTPATVGTIDGKEVATGEYLAYMYTQFMDVYFSQGLYQYAQYGMDGWEQELTYGEGDAAQKVSVAEYIRLATRDDMLTQAAMRQLMAKYAIQWDEKELKNLEESFATADEEEFLSMGISKEHLLGAYKNISLNQTALLNGLYGKGGEREIAEADLKKYFNENYLSYKMISISLTDDESKELSDADKKVYTDLLNGYLADYNKDQNFEAVVDKYNKYVAEKDKSTEKVEASKNEDNLRNADATDMDEYLAKEIRKLEVGKAAVVEYKAGGSTPTAALILRLDPNSTEDLYANSNEAIIRKLKGEELEKEIADLAAKVQIDLKKSAVKKCDPKKFEEMMY